MLVKELIQILKNVNQGLEVVYVHSLSDITSPFDETVHIDNVIAVTASNDESFNGIYLTSE